MDLDHIKKNEFVQSTIVNRNKHDLQDNIVEGFRVLIWEFVYHKSEQSVLPCVQGGPENAPLYFLIFS